MHVSEVYRAGIESVHPSQDAAARLDGAYPCPVAALRRDPSGSSASDPALLNDFIGLQKDTALVSVLGVVEVLRRTQINEATAFSRTCYLVAATLFVAITIPLARFTDGSSRATGAGGGPEA